jgi:DNA-binding NarL/FixJ family response regulator
LREAIGILDEIGAKPASSLARLVADQQGISIPLPKPRRGPYRIAKQHPLGLTSREVQILELIAKGLGNGDIAKTLNRSQRTVEHHVSAVLGKLNAQNRMDVMLRLRNEPWLTSVSEHARQIQI